MRRNLGIWELPGEQVNDQKQYGTPFILLAHANAPRQREHFALTRRIKSSKPGQSTTTMNASTVLVLPGYANSGPGHWQTRWEAVDSVFVRAQMPDWNHPVCEAWCDALDAAVRAADGPVLFAAHSLGCLTAVHWAARHATETQRAKVAGALLVAVPEPGAPAFPDDALGYDDVPLVRLPFPTRVVASSNDPYCSLAFARRCAQAWGSRFVDVGERGHINADSGLGDWPEGRAWLASLAYAEQLPE